MKKFLRLTVLTVVMLAQLLAGVNVGVSAEANIPGESNQVSVTLDGVQTESQNQTGDQTQYEGGIESSVPTNNENESKNVAVFDDTDKLEEVNKDENKSEIVIELLPEKKDDAELNSTDEGLLADTEISSESSNLQVLNSIIKEENSNTTEATIKIIGLSSDTPMETKVQIEDEATALSLLQASASVEIEDSTSGPIIKSINGLQKKGAYYWAFYVNGEFAQIGAHRYIPKRNDIITFKYEWKNPEKTFPAGTLKDQINQTAEWILTKGITSPWEALALKQAGKDVPESYFQMIETEVVGKNGEYRNVTDYEKIVLTLVAGGKDPTNIQGYNLVEKIYNNEKMTNQGINGVIYGLLALDSNDFPIPDNAKWSRGQLIKNILDAQNADGGWALFGTSSDVDITAMTLAALAPYKKQDNVKEAINKAVGWLSEIQLENGGFKGYSGENSQTTAIVLIGLSALDEDPKKGEFTKENGNVIEYLASYVLDDGSFKFLQKNSSSNNMATEQGLMALVSYAMYLNGKGSIYDFSNVAEQPSAPNKELPFSSISELLEKIVNWIQHSSTGVDNITEVIALRHLENEIPKEYFEDIKSKINKAEGQFSNLADYENYVLSLISGNMDPTNFQNNNLIENIYNHDQLTAQGVLGLRYALIALDSKSYQIPNDSIWSRDQIINRILDYQNNEGGWSWAVDQPTDIDTTAMVLTALAPYQDQPRVKEAIDEAINLLSRKQLNNGGYDNGWGENSATASTVLTAITALGIDPLEKFAKMEGNIISYIHSYLLEDGSFEFIRDGGSDEAFSTPQALLALLSYKRFIDEKGSVYDLSNLPPLKVGETGGGGQGGSTPNEPGEIKKQTITISVRTHESTILSSKTLEVNEGATALSALVDELGGRVETRGSGESGYVVAIDGLAEFDHGPTSGWKYSVNGYFPGSGAGSYKLSNGDQLEWVYVTEDKDAANEKSSMGGSVATAKPDGVTVTVFESFEKLKSDTQKQNEVLNKEQKMSVKEVQKLKEVLNLNNVKVEKTVVPSEETVIASPNGDEAKIVIPKDALTEQKTIKIEELAPSTTNIEGNLKSSIYQFTPKGTKFDKPVYISINIPIEDDDLDNLVMAWFDEEKSQWIPIPTVIDAKTGMVTGLVDHFTKFAVINNKKESKLAYTEELEKLIQHLQTDKTQSEWEDFGMARLGKADNQAVLADISKVVKETNGYFRKITDYERYVLTIEALGGDPTNIGGYDLIGKIYNNERMTMQGTNGLIFALIALDSGNYQVPRTAKWSREKILADILANQNKDGGFTLVNGDASDVDITAMAISSLINYKDKPEVKTAIDKAVNWLSSVQQASGGFIADGSENSESASQVIIALASAGVDPEGTQFTKANGNVVTNLLSYQTNDGGFANLKNEKSNQIASEQALLALLALDHYSKNLPSIYQFADLKVEKETSINIPDFSDVDQISDYALQSIYDAFDKGIMYGVENNPLRFAPKQNLTRAQFTAILVNLLEGKVEEQSNVIFTDVKPGQWYYNVVMKAHELGIVRGTSNTSFSPNDPITREQVAIILARAFDLMTDENESKTTIYNDVTNLSPYNQAAIQALYDHNLMKGYEGGQFKPKNYVTREMGAVIAVRLIKQS